MKGVLQDNESSIGCWVSILYRYRQNYLSKRLDPYNIGSGQHMFLLALAYNDGISQEELSERLKLDKATTAKALKKLEDEGYVARGIDAADKRAYQVFLTPLALRVIPLIKKAVEDWEQLITADLSEDESFLIKQLLRKMAQNACQYKKGS